MTTVKKRKNIKLGNRLSDMQFDEVSVVTSPANQHSRIVLWKSEDGAPTMSDSTRELLSKKGLDIDSLPEHVIAAMDELVSDNRTIAKAMIREQKRQAALQDELDYGEEETEPFLEATEEVWVAKEEWAPSLDATFLEEDIVDDVHARAQRVQAEHTKLSIEQAIAKVVHDTPDIYRAYRAAQLLKADASSIAKADTHTSHDVRRQYAAEKMESQQAAISAMRERAEEMVDFGQVPTVEAGIVQLCREQPELWKAWNQSFREPM